MIVDVCCAGAALADRLFRLGFNPGWQDFWAALGWLRSGIAG
jgi:hypothetical protein